MIQPEIAQRVLKEVEEQLSYPAPGEEVLQKVMQLLHDRLPPYHWVGIYWLQGDTLVLGPYVGPPTEHIRIPVGRGVCGTAVAENRNQIVSDVHQMTNYLACNSETRSEIVVLIREPETGRILGQIDVDSTQLAAFDHSDEQFLQEVGERVAKVIANRRR